MPSEDTTRPATVRSINSREVNAEREEAERLEEDQRQKEALMLSRLEDEADRFIYATFGADQIIPDLPPDWEFCSSFRDIITRRIVFRIRIHVRQDDGTIQEVTIETPIPLELIDPNSDGEARLSAACARWRDQSEMRHRNGLYLSHRHRRVPDIGFTEIKGGPVGIDSVPEIDRASVDLAIDYANAEARYGVSITNMISDTISENVRRIMSPIDNLGSRLSEGRLVHRSEFPVFTQSAEAVLPIDESLSGRATLVRTGTTIRAEDGREYKVVVTETKKIELHPVTPFWIEQLDDKDRRIRVREIR